MKAVAEKVGGTDAVVANKLVSKLMQSYGPSGMTKDVAGDIIYGSITDGGLLNSYVNGKKLQNTLVNALASDRYQDRNGNPATYDQLSKKQKDALHKETAGIINPIINE